MDLLPVEEIRSEVERLAQKIHAPAHSLPTYGRADGSARPNVEVDDRGYHWVVEERGKEYERVTITSLDELLDRIFAAVTSVMASRYAAENRIESEEFRLTMWRRQLELLNALSPAWAERLSRKIEAILGINPFNATKTPD